MDRTSFLYKARRKMQTVAFSILPHDTLSKLYYKIYLHEELNIDNPKTLNEKLQWYKLNYCPNNPLVVQCSDKYQVRSYIEDKGYASSLTALIGVWEDAKDIDWDKLPQMFVLKCTHGCAYNILSKEKSTFDKTAAVKQLNRWLQEDFAKFNVELHYGKIKPRRIICEEYLGDVIIDYKFFCFNGEPKFFYVSSDLVHDRQAEMGFFNMDRSKIPLIRDDYKDIGNITMPECLSYYIKHEGSISSGSKFKLIKYHYILWHDACEKNKFVAAILTLNNLFWGALKKMYYKEKI